MQRYTRLKAVERSEPSLNVLYSLKNKKNMRTRFAIIAFAATLFVTHVHAQGVGVNTTSTTNKLTVNGNTSIGSGYTATTAPTDGALIEGSTGIGTVTTTNAKLTVVATSSSIDAVRATNTSTSTTASYGAIRGNLSGTGYTATAAYLGYHSTTNKTFGIYSNSGDYGGWFAVPVGIGSNQPTTTNDLEVNNISSGNPASILMRQTSSNTTSGATLASIGFGDNYTTAPQAQIQVARGATSSNSSDLPTDLVFSTTPDASSTLTERLRITNSGALSVNGSVGTTGQVLTSNGNAPPTWNSPYGGNIQSVVGTTDITINTATFTDMPTMTITFTPKHSVVYLNFSAAGDQSTSSLPGECYVEFRVQTVISGTTTTVAGTISLTTDHDDVDGTATAWNAHFTMYPLTVTPGTSTTVKIQWMRSGIFTSTVNNAASSQKNYSHRSLTILD